MTDHIYQYFPTKILFSLLLYATCKLNRCNWFSTLDLSRFVSTQKISSKKITDYL